MNKKVLGIIGIIGLLVIVGIVINKLKRDAEKLGIDLDSIPEIKIPENEEHYE